MDKGNHRIAVSLSSRLDSNTIDYWQILFEIKAKELKFTLQDSLDLAPPRLNGTRSHLVHDPKQGDSCAFTKPYNITVLSVWTTPVRHAMNSVM